MASNDPKQFVRQVGAALRKVRKDRGLNLEQLAELTGVSKLTLGNLERGETNPTLGVLWKISTALELPLLSLFKSGSSVNISQAGKGLRISGEAKNWAIEPIFQHMDPGMEMYRAYLQPNSSYQPEAHHAGTTELATVMTGSASILVGGETHQLDQHDSISFPADQQHAYINKTDSMAVLHIILKYSV